MRIPRVILPGLLALVVMGCQTERAPGRPKILRRPTAEDRALAYLSREVPLWFRENKCFSCHNNGDAARALYAASALGYRIPQGALADTTAWLQRPGQWDYNKGDPAFSDKRLARIQFTVALASAVHSGQVTDKNALLSAARKLVEEQHADGSWHIDPVSALGSPATYGTPLATAMAMMALLKVPDHQVIEARQKAERWLRQSSVENLPAAAAVLFALHGHEDAAAAAKRQACLDLIRRSQTHDGGWGPYVDSPPELFDTAVVLLALAGIRPERSIEALIQRGRNYLLQTQLADGSWPETTRPPRGESYAQRLSTAGWATEALLRTASVR